MLSDQTRWHLGLAAAQVFVVTFLCWSADIWSAPEKSQQFPGHLGPSAFIMAHGVTAMCCDWPCGARIREERRSNQAEARHRRRQTLDHGCRGLCHRRDGAGPGQQGPPPGELLRAARPPRMDVERDWGLRPHAPARAQARRRHGKSDEERAAHVVLHRLGLVHLQPQAAQRLRGQPALERDGLDPRRRRAANLVVEHQGERRGVHHGGVHVLRRADGSHHVGRGEQGKHWQLRPHLARHSYAHLHRVRARVLHGQDGRPTTRPRGPRHRVAPLAKPGQETGPVALTQIHRTRRLYPGAEGPSSVDGVSAFVTTRRFARSACWDCRGGERRAVSESLYTGRRRRGQRQVGGVGGARGSGAAGAAGGDGGMIGAVASVSASASASEARRGVSSSSAAAAAATAWPRTACICALDATMASSVMAEVGANTSRPSSCARLCDGSATSSARLATHMPQCPRAISPRSCVLDQRASPQNASTVPPRCASPAEPPSRTRLQVLTAKTRARRTKDGDAGPAASASPSAASAGGASPWRVAEATRTSQRCVAAS